MADWKERGYVPDSDDEDDLEIHHSEKTQLLRYKPARLEEVPAHSTKSQVGVPQPLHKSYRNTETRPSIDQDRQNVRASSTDLGEHSTPDGIPTTAELLSATINRGLATVREVLSPRDCSRLEEVASRESSLSPPPSSLDEYDSFLHLNSPRAPVLNDHLIPSSTAVDAYQRTLRERKAIQQHPYSLEDAKYRQLWQERGLKPVHAREQIVPAVQQVDEDSQGTDVFPGTQLQESATQQSSSLDHRMEMEEESQSPRPGVRSSRNIDNDNLDDELPELSFVLQKRQLNSTEGLRRARKRKPQPIPNSDGRSHLKSFDFDLPSSDEELQNPSLTPFGIARDSFPSPPLSLGVSSSEPMVLSQKSPRIVTPAVLPTPLVSSEARSNKRILADLLDDSADTFISDDDVESERSSIGPSQNREPLELQTIQRRIKGVLPASWLKLDLAKQGSHNRQKQARQSPLKTVTEKGLARHLSTNRRDNRDTTQKPTVLDLDLGDSEDEDAATLGELGNHAIDTVDLLSDSASSDQDSHDVVEEDFIDAMLPYERRNQRRSGLGRFRQIESDASGVRPKPIGSVALTKLSRKDVIRNSKGEKANRRKRPKRRHVTATTSILDAPGLQNQDRKVQPSYLRIAARRARANIARSHKHASTSLFPLNNSEDTADVTSTYEQRHSDKLYNGGASANNAAPNQNPRRNHQPHVSTAAFRTTDRNQNKEVNGISDFSKDLATLKRSTDILLQKVHQGTTDSRFVPVLSHLNIDNSKTSDVSHLKSLFPHRNRSGAGYFAARPIAPRPAQLEASLVKPDQSRTLKRIPQRTAPRPRNEESDVQALDEGNLQHPRAQISKKRKPILPKKMNVNAKQTTLIFGHTDESRTQIPGYSPYEAEGDAVAKTVLGLRGQDACFIPPAELHGGLISTGALASLDAFVHSSSQSLTSTIFKRQQPHEVVLSMPNTNAQQSCGIWNSEAEATLNIVFEDLSAFARDILVNGETDQEAFFRRRDVLDKLISYVNTTLYFANAGDAGWYIQIVAQALTKFSSSISLLLESKPNTGKAHYWTLAILNRIVVLGVFANHINECLGKESIPTFKLTVESSILLAARIALSPSSINQIVMRRNAQGPLDLTHSPAVETIHLLVNLSEFWSGSGNFRFLWEVIQKTLDNLQAPTTYLRLAQLQAMIYAVTPFLNIDHQGQVIPDGSEAREQDHSAAWKLLFDCLRAFSLEHVEDFERNTTVSKLRMQVFADTRHLCEAFRCVIPPTMLELWFHQYETAWFQSRSNLNSKEFLHPIRDVDQISFSYFIESLSSFLGDLPTGCPKARREIRALIYKVMPNRGEIGASGEIGNKLNMLPVNDLQPIQNLFDLHTWLLIDTPQDLKPRMQPLMAKVSFTTAHNDICSIALESWNQVEIMTGYEPNNEVIKDLSVWIQSMIAQTVDRFKLAHSDYLSARLDIRSSFQGMPESSKRSEEISYLENIAKQMMQYNQQKACDLLESVIERYEVALQRYSKSWAAQLALGNGQFTVLTQFAMNHSKMSTGTATKMVELIHKLASHLVTHFDRSMSTEVLTQIRRVLHECLSEEVECDDRLLAALIRLWFVPAHKLVQSQHMSWDNFLTPQSNYALDMIASQENLGTAKTMLFVLIIDNDPMYYSLECRLTFITHWITVLLSPLHKMSFAVELTTSIFEQEEQHMLLGNLIRSLEYADEDELSLDVLLEYRLDIVRALIQYFHHLSVEVGGDYMLDEGLDAADGLYILRTMFMTMKQTWMSTETDHDDADEYGRLVRYALEEIELCPVPNLNIDSSWFTLPEHKSCRQALTNAFRSRPDSNNHFGRSLACEVIFHRSLLEAAGDGHLQGFAHDMKQIFLPTDFELVQGTVGNLTYSVDLIEQACFIKNVFPPYFKRAVSCDGEPLAYTIAIILNHVLDRLHLRIDALAAETTRPLLQATFAVLSALHEAMEKSKDVHDKVYIHGVFFELVGSIFDRAYTLGGDVVPEDIAGQVEDILEWVDHEAELSKGQERLIESILSKIYLN